MSAMTRRQARSAIARLLTLGAAQRERMLRSLPRPALRAIADEWWWQAHGGQIEPPRMEDGRDWRVWLIMAGRGFGKTRAGAEWVWARARTHPGARIALVGGSLDEVAKVMVEGESGLLAIARAGEEPRWRPGRGELVFPGGASAFAYTAERPGKLRGPQHHFAWCDELAKWAHGRETWDNVMLGLRLGEAPRTIVTTTPKPGSLLTRVKGLERTQLTRGKTADNPHLPADFRQAVTEMYGGTRIGRQELDGVLFEDVQGALWTRELIEASRVALDFARDERALVRVVVGVDPPASADGDACGIVACGIDAAGVMYVLGDHTLSGASPAGWAAKVAAAAEIWGADRVVAEGNNGGNMVEEVLRAADSALPVRMVHASRGKSARAEPVVSRFEAGKAKFAGCFPELEDELCGMTSGGGYDGRGRSPDRADAMVWAMTELMKKQRTFRVRAL